MDTPQKEKKKRESISRSPERSNISSDRAQFKAPKSFQSIADQSLQVTNGMAVMHIANGTHETKDKKPEKQLSLGEIKDALGYTNNYGVANSGLDEEELEKLKAAVQELGDSSELEEIIDAINDKLGELGEDSEESWDDDSELEELHQKLNKVEFVSAEELVRIREQAANNFGWARFPDERNGWIKIGVHETNSENVAGLVKDGPLESRIDTGHHVGKGRGFYVTPVGERELRTATRGVAYGENFVAVYVKSTVKEARSYSTGSDHVTAMDKQYRDEERYYLMSGGGEIVIPERCFRKIMIVSSLAELSKLV